MDPRKTIFLYKQGVVHFHVWPEGGVFFMGVSFFRGKPTSSTLCLEDHFPLQTGGNPFPCLARRGCILHGFVLFQREAHQFDPVFGRTNTSQTHCLGGFSLLKLQATVLVVGDFETSLSFSFLFYRNIRSLYSVPVTDMNQ